MQTTTLQTVWIQSKVDAMRSLLLASLTAAMNHLLTALVDALQAENKSSLFRIQEDHVLCRLAMLAS